MAVQAQGTEQAAACGFPALRTEAEIDEIAKRQRYQQDRP